MNDFIQRFLFLSLAVLIFGSFVGCRQPGSLSSQTSGRSAFLDFRNLPKLFGSGSGSRYANNDSRYGFDSGFGNGGNNGGNLGGSFGTNGNNSRMASNGGGGFGFLGGSKNRDGSGSGNQDRYASNLPDLDVSVGDVRGGQGGMGTGGIGTGGNLGGQNIAGEFQNLNQQLGATDADNQLLNTEVATLQQKLQLANQYNQGLKEQLAGTSSQIQQTMSERQAAAQQVASLQAQLQQANRSLQLAQQNQQANPNNGGQLVGYNNGSNGGRPTQLAGGATIRANNSLMNQLSKIQIPGGNARMDGDVIRIEFPSDRLFVPGTYQIQPAQMPLLQNIVGTIRESFSRQIVGVEAHWDGTPLNPAGTTDHQLTATQALSVFEQLVRLGLPDKQLFTMAMASNRPRHSQSNLGGVSPNRRIELVIYPETYDR